MVPQRAPSTRLSSVPITEELRPRSVAADSTVPVKETPGSVASSPNSHLKSASSNCVSSVVEKLAISVDEPTIDHMVPPVSDIIRHFDRRGQLIVGAACRPGFVPPKPISNGTREDSRVNTVPTSSNESNTTHSDRKVSMPINSFGLITPTQSQTSTGHESDLMSSPKMQQMMRGFTLSRSNSVETNRRAPSSLGLCTSPLVRTISPPVLSPTAKLLPPSASQLSSSKHLVPESRVCNGHSSSPSPLSSFRSVSRISTHGSTRHSPPLPSPPPPQHVMPSVTSVNRSNSINHRVIDPSDSETSSCHPVVSSQSVFPSSPPPPPTCTPPPPPPPSPPSIPAPIPPMAVSPIGLATRVSGQVTDQAKTQLNPHVVHQQLANTLQQRRASAETRPTTEKPRKLCTLVCANQFFMIYHHIPFIMAEL
ncbi:hypothetical protein D915_008968 [Fasciola hepatica]|uniref:Uncharacterized protein n=1 Tax=Fasciola hepatica TaxID=6192 RepID=A0A4E0RXE6_FASHE|nr:hypothetical protein D915_008968 [Fasciola hepatica]